MTLEFIFSEFGSRDQANQQWINPLPRLDPTYSSVKKYFPEVKSVALVTSWYHSSRAEWIFKKVNSFQLISPTTDV